VVKSRTLVAFAVLVVWISMPALACLPNHSMAQSEMECCKKMVGDCQMGVGQHHCCKRGVNRTASVAKVEHSAQSQPQFLAVPVSVLAPPAKIIDCAFTAQLGLPPPAPPGVVSVLRI
jgi:hypothetical protein